MITGSARSNNEFDIYSIIESCSSLLENFGGHTCAVGLTLKEENLQLFIDRFLQLANEGALTGQTVPQIDIDAEIELCDITPKLVAELRKMNPYGADNPKPMFCSKNVKDYGTSKLVGKELEHLKLEIIDEHAQSPIHGIAFGMHHYYDLIKSTLPFDICYTVEENTYNGNTAVQLVVKDIRPTAR
jgi:single-stranded-DNA-specific exonuclease